MFIPSPRNLFFIAVWAFVLAGPASAASDRQKLCRWILAGIGAYQIRESGGTPEFRAAATTRVALLYEKLLRAEIDGTEFDPHHFPLAIKDPETARHWRRLKAANYHVRGVPIVAPLAGGRQEATAARLRDHQLAAQEFGFRLGTGQRHIELMVGNITAPARIFRGMWIALDPEISFCYGVVIARFHSLTRGTDPRSAIWNRFVEPLIEENADFFRARFAAVSEEMKELRLKVFPDDAVGDLRWRRLAAEDLARFFARRVAWERTLAFYEKALESDPRIRRQYLDQFLNASPVQRHRRLIENMELLPLGFPQGFTRKFWDVPLPANLLN